MAKQRLIDVNEAVKLLRGSCVARYPSTFLMGLFAAADEIAKLPTVDAVPVVRCEKCVYWQEPWDGSASPSGRCRRNDMTMAGSGFCSYGERRAKDGC